MLGWNPIRKGARGAGRPQGHDPVLLGAGCGLVEGTQVATDAGWSPVETLRPGQSILTFDGGMQPVTALLRDEIWHGHGACPETLWPLYVPDGLIGNPEAMLVMPNQGVLLETDEVADEWGDPFAVIPAAALAAVEGVERHEPYGTVEVVLPVFAEDQMVFADHGVLLFAQAHWGVSAGILPRNGVATNYNMLPMSEALGLLERMAEPDNADCAVA